MQPLGSWLPNKSHIKYQFYIHSTSGHLWDVINNRCFQKRIYQRVYSKNYSHGEPPFQQMSPALVYEYPTVYRVDCDSRIVEEIVMAPKYTFHHFLAIFPSSVQSLLPHIKIPKDDGETIAHSVLQGTIIGASDGSVKEKNGTYGYILYDKCSLDKISGYGKVPTTATHPTSQRSEIYGAAATILVYIVLQQRYGITSKIPLQHYIDNEGVVKLLQQKELSPGLKQHLASDIDMYMFILHLIKTFNISVNWNWIRSHQDDHADIAELSIEAQLNVEADYLTKKGYSLPSHNKQHLPGTKVSIYIDNDYMSDTNMKESIILQHHSEDILEYLKDKYSWTTETSDLIDWDLFQETYSNKPFHHMTHIIKYIHQFCAIFTHC